MLERQYTKHHVESFDPADFNKLNDLIGKLLAIQQAIPYEYRAEATIDVDYDYDNRSTYEVQYRVPEPEDVYKARVAKAQAASRAAKERKEKQDYETFLKLKERFEGSGSKT